MYFNFESTLSYSETLYYYDDYDFGGETDDSEDDPAGPDSSQPTNDSSSSGSSNAAGSIENSSINGRRYYTNGVDLLNLSKSFNIGLLSGNDVLEVTGGSSNFANGNNGEDLIILRGGQGRYLGGADNDRLQVFSAGPGSWVNGNKGMDIVTGSVDGVTYRGGSENDTLQVSAGTVWGDKGADIFQAVAGAGVAVVQDYTAGEDRVQGVAGGGFMATAQGLSYGAGGDQMLLLLNINDPSLVTLI